jgi:hypothetical protein
MYVSKEVDRDLMRLRKESTSWRPLYDYFSNRDIIELGDFRILIESMKNKDEIVPKRKLVI